MQTPSPPPPEPLAESERLPRLVAVRRAFRAVLFAQAVVAGLGVLDYLTGVKFHFSIIYLVPVSFAALRGGLGGGVITAATSSVAWFLAQRYGGADLGTGWIALWNGLACFTGFSVVAVGLARASQLNHRLAEKARKLSLEIETRERIERIHLDEKERLNRELRKLSELLIEAQEAERRRIARDLHDSVNQLLSTITFRVGMIAEQLSGADLEVRDELDKAKLLLAKSIEEIHRISEGLRPSELDALGLVPAVRSLCQEFQQKSSLDLKLDLSVSTKHFPDAVELTLYRIIQEAFHNIEKHSGASQAALALKENSCCLNLTIRDNGKGLASPAEDAGKRVGMGLLNMRERAAFLGGTFSIHSTAENGTEIVVGIPFPVSNQNQNQDL